LPNILDVPETDEHGCTYICFDVDIKKSINKTYLIPTIYIWVFSHKSKLRIPDGGGVRPDIICQKIAETINSSYDYGLGRLELYAVNRFAPATDHIGKVMTFMAKDFNNTSPTGKKIPANRKSG